MITALNQPPLRRGRKYDRVVDAAQALFLEQGYGQVSMDAIVARAGISKSTLYSYFRSKEDLFAAVVRAVCEGQMAEYPVDRLDPARPREGLNQLALLLLHIIVEPSSISAFRTMMAESGRFPELGRVFYESGPVYLLAIIENYLRRLAADGALAVESIEEAAWHFGALVKMQMHDMLLWNVVSPPTEAQISAQAARAVRLFLRAYARPADGG